MESSVGFVKQELKKYNLPDAEIAQMEKDFLILKVKDPRDLDAYNLCKVRHQEVRDIRVSIEKKRKELKAGSIAFGKAIEAEAKRLTVAVLKIETHLLIQRKVVEDDQERKHREKEEAEAKRLEDIRLEEERKRKEEDDRQEKERQRLAGIEKKQQEERDRIAAEDKRIAEEKIRQDKEAIRQEEEAKRLEREAKEAEEKKEREAKEAEEQKQKEIEDSKRLQEEEKKRKEREAEAAKEREKQRLADIEKAKKDEADRIEKERLEALEAKRKEEEEAKRLEALKPDFEKLKLLAQRIAAFGFPIVESAIALKAVNKARLSMASIVEDLYSVEKEEGK